MKEKLAALKIEYRTNPGWCWLLAILFLFPLLPEYVSPFILFVGFIVFKVQWSREGRKAKVGTIGKMMMLFMGLCHSQHPVVPHVIFHFFHRCAVVGYVSAPGDDLQLGPQPGQD